MPRSVFLLSPANTSGLRAQQLMSPRAKSETAQLFRTPEGVPIAIAFAYMSALYFRGKITYAMHFGGVENTFVIAPGYGGKYVDILWPIFANRLRFPTHFAGLGDMSRGGLLLRAARADRELAYTTLEAPRHRVGGGSGKMPSLDIAAAK